MIEPFRQLLHRALCAAAMIAVLATTAGAQTTDAGRQPAPANSAPPLLPTINDSGVSTTDLFRQGGANQNADKQPDGRLNLTALLTNNGPQIKRGLKWRVYSTRASSSALTLQSTHDRAGPTLTLAPGTYAVNVTFGLAHLTRMIKINPADDKSERFVINAGGLKILARTDAGKFASPTMVTYDLYSDERDQHGKRKKILSRVRPGRITRLNSGIYRIVSHLGDANAVVAAEVTVEAGKLTEATVVHEAAKVTFKLVQSAGGDALADAQWIIMTQAGKIVKETAGALPSHVLAPGNYTISARWGGKLHTRTFAIKSGDNVEVEVVIR